MRRCKAILKRAVETERKGAGLLTVHFTIEISDCDLPFSWGDSHISAGKSFFLGPVQFVQRRTFHSQAFVPMSWLGMEREVRGFGSRVQTAVFSQCSPSPHPELRQCAPASGVSLVKFHWPLNLQKGDGNLLAVRKENTGVPLVLSMQCSYSQPIFQRW